MTSKARNSRGTTDEVTPSYRVIEAETVPLVVRLVSGLDACEGTGGNGVDRSTRLVLFASRHSPHQLARRPCRETLRAR